MTGNIRRMVARRSDYSDTNDFVPTPPYVTRALFKHVIPWVSFEAPFFSAWDPSAGMGHMLKPLTELVFKEVIGSDLVPREPAYPDLPEITQLDFLKPTDQRADVIIMNPPYGQFNDFVRLGLERSNRVLAVLCRIQALEGQRRWESTYRTNPPSVVAVFADRIPFRVGRITSRTTKMFTHCWMVFEHGLEGSRLAWIPPTVQRELEIEADYQDATNGWRQHNGEWCEGEGQQPGAPAP